MKTRVLFFAESVTLSHRMRPDVLARGLDPERYEVALAAGEFYANLFDPFPGANFDLQSLSPSEFSSALWWGKPFYDYKRLNAQVQKDLKLIESFRPDLVVGDFRLSLGISSKVARVPWINLTNCYWAPSMMTEWQSPESFFTHLFGVKLTNALLNRFPGLLLKPHLDAYIRASKHWKVQVPPNLSLNEWYHQGDFQFYCDVPDFLPPEALSLTAQVLGPIPWNPSVKLPLWLKDVPEHMNIVYLNLGSSGAQKILPKIVGILLSLNCCIIVGCPDSVKLPSHQWVFRSPFLPGIEVCERSNMVICNGGSPSTQQAFLAGVPVMGICNNLDQMLNMNIVCRQGLGVSMRSDQFNEQGFLWSFRELSENRMYGVRARELSEKLKAWDVHHRFEQLLNASLISSQAFSA